MTEFNETQTLLLSIAPQRDSGSLYPLPDTLALGARITTAITKLIGRGYVAEGEIQASELAYRIDGDLSFGLFITSAGLAAIGIAGENSANPEQAPPPHAPKPNKSDTVLALLARVEGATRGELIAITDWLPHSVSAALTGLRKKGHAITRGKRGDVTCYRIAAAA